MDLIVTILAIIGGITLFVGLIFIYIKITDVKGYKKELVEERKKIKELVEAHTILLNMLITVNYINHIFLNPDLADCHESDKGLLIDFSKTIGLFFDLVIDNKELIETEDFNKCIQAMNKSFLNINNYYVYHLVDKDLKIPFDDFNNLRFAFEDFKNEVYRWHPSIARRYAQL